MDDFDESKRDIKIRDDLETIFLLYEPLINKFSTVDGHFDEDLHQYLLICIAQSIFKFRI